MDPRDAEACGREKILVWVNYVNAIEALPVNMTGKLQVMDLAVNEPLKTIYMITQRGARHLPLVNSESVISELVNEKVMIMLLSRDWTARRCVRRLDLIPAWPHVGTKARGALRPERWRLRIPLVKCLGESTNAGGTEGIVMRLHAANTAPFKAAIVTPPLAGDGRVKSQNAAHVVQGKKLLRLWVALIVAVCPPLSRRHVGHPLR